MLNRFIFAILSIIILCLFFLAACDVDIPVGTPTPTQDSVTTTTAAAPTSDKQTAQTRQTETKAQTQPYVTVTTTNSPVIVITEPPVTTTTSTKNITAPTSPVVVPSTITADAVDTYFDNNIFVGDSLMLGFNNFAISTRGSGGIPSYLGTSKFFCGGSFGVYNNKGAITDDSTHPLYQGTKYTIQDMVGVSGTNRIFLSLGMNDIAMYGDPDNCVQNFANDYIALIDEIRTKYPSVEIAVFSTTYLIESYNGMARLNNKNISTLNATMLAYCTSKGYDFIDVSSPLLGANKCLDDTLCSDEKYHLRGSGYRIWTAVLRDYAARKTAGTYTNPSSMEILFKS